VDRDGKGQSGICLTGGQAQPCTLRCNTSDPGRITRGLSLIEQALSTAEFLAVDTETNGLSGEGLEVVEVGAVLVGGGELHDRWSTMVRAAVPMRRAVRRLTGISQELIDAAPEPEQVMPELARRLEGRVLVAHNAPFDRRALRITFERCGLEWPDPPVLCTAAMARALLPLQPERRLGALAAALGIEVAEAHRALADAVTCGQVLCALFGRLCANAATVGDAIALLRPRRPRRPGKPRRFPAAQDRPELDFSRLPRDPGVYLFRDQQGRTLYVGKSISIRSRARAHFAPSTAPADWSPHATIVDYRPTTSELGALILENRLIKELRPPGNTRLTRRDDRLVYIRCRLDIPFPILEVASEPAAGHAVSIGPVRGRSLAAELVEQIESLFGLRHCGRRLVRRQWPSAYGQMGRCLSPCLGDLDPNLYRRRLDAALDLFLGDGGQALLDHVGEQMRAAAASRHYERAAWLRRRAGRLRIILDRLGGVLEATHVRPRLILAAHPVDSERHDAFWLVSGRLVDWGPLPAEPAELAQRTRAALRHHDGVRTGTHVPPGEIDEVRILETYLASHPQLPQLTLDPEPQPATLQSFVAARPSGEGQLDHLGLDARGADADGLPGIDLAANQRQGDRAQAR
jgi:DNA polymerase-3 subunit epsilon